MVTTTKTNQQTNKQDTKSKKDLLVGYEETRPLFVGGTAIETRKLGFLLELTVESQAF